jgi:RimJ/RimL family protein N-acetyltransferase
MKITFAPLAQSHFSLLLKWLEAPHVKTWWDADINWTPELIQKKYGERINNKIIFPYIIYADDHPIGYIQLYRVHDFPRSKPLNNIPQNCAAIDVFIGEQKFIHRGVGSKAIRQFLEHYCDPFYTHTFTNPDINNIAAIKAYENAGFERINEQPDSHEVWMLRGNKKT